jgi:hypothetical protein
MNALASTKFETIATVLAGTIAFVLGCLAAGGWTPW